MPRFVVLHHVMRTGGPRPSHFDLMLEDGGVLLTWAIASPPTSGVTIVAEALPEHRLAYLEFEGEISGNRGAVTRWDAGTYETIPGNANGLTARVFGNKLDGTITITRNDLRDSAWTLSYHPLPPGEGRVMGR